MPALALLKQLHVPSSAGYKWLATRAKIGDIASRRHDGRVEKQLLRGNPGSGRPREITDNQLNQLLDSDQVSRQQPLQIQLLNSGI